MKKSLLDCLTNPRFVCMLMAARDVMGEVDQFSRDMQEDGLLVHAVRLKVDGESHLSP